MEKPVIFLSHIHEEKALAGLLKNVIEDSFLKMVDVFVSSDNESLCPGDEWLEAIFEHLETAVAMFLLCSQRSVARPWINFEAGAGWIRKRLQDKGKLKGVKTNIEIIPLCHTGMQPSKLPVPLNLLTAIDLSDEAGLESVFKVIASKLAGVAPSMDYKKLVQNIQAVKIQYAKINEIEAVVQALCKIEPRWKAIFKADATDRIFTGSIHESLLNEMKPHLRVLTNENIATLSLGGSSFALGTGPGMLAGTTYNYSLEVHPTYYDLGKN